MDPFKYREVQALFTARLPDSADSDQLPDRIPLNGYGTLRPNIRGTSVVFTEVGEFAVPRTRQVAIVDGELLVEVIDGESSILQPLFLEVTVDERANQEWSWTLTFDTLEIGEQGGEISHPALSFPVEDGEGPLELSTVATTATRTANFITRGPRGYGITGITESGGEVTVSWDGGEDIALPIPGTEYVNAAADAARWARGELTAGMDLNHLPREGHYFARSFSSVQQIIGWPDLAEGTPGHLEELRTSSGLNIQRVTTYGAAMKIIQRTVLSATNQTWSEWYVVWARDGSHLPDIPVLPDVPEDAYVQHQIRQTQFVQAMGGPIDTGGRAAVAFRMDHGLASFASKLLPLFRARGIVPSMVYNPRSWDRPENAGVTAADLNQWVADGDVEIWNHGATHSNVHTEAELYDEIVNSLHEIEAELPAAAGKVWGFAPPGVGAGGYGGFGSGSSPEDWDTYAGRMILKHHAVTAAYLYGTGTRPLDGVLRDGLSHYTMDRATVSAIKGRIDTGITRGHGVQLMVHPSLIDTEGYITTAQIEEILDYVVAKRDAEKLLTLSPYQMLIADSTRSAEADEYKSGRRDITGLIPNVQGGSAYVWRQGSTVWVDFYRLQVTDPADSPYHTFENFLPPGFRPAQTHYIPLAEASSGSTRGPAAPVTNGHFYVYNAVPDKRIDGLISFPTPDPAPTTLPGTPA